MSTTRVPAHTKTGDKWTEIGTAVVDDRSASADIKIAKNAPITVHGDRPADAASWPN